MFWYPPCIFSFQVLPSITAIDDIYGQMLRGRFTKSEFDNSTLAVVDGLTRATIELWRKVKSKLLPTPAKFHYVFNLRDLSRIFAGVLMTPKNTIINGGTMKAGQDGSQQGVKHRRSVPERERLIESDHLLDWRPHR